MPVSVFQDKIASLTPKQREALLSLLKERHPTGPKRLSAFVTKEDGALFPTGNELQKQLANYLPSYMVPRAYKILDTLPLTPHGKIDRQKLSSQTYQQQEIDTDDFNSKPTEKSKLKSIWEKAFGKQITTGDDFFEQGGDSIMAMQIVSQARAAGIELRVTDLFKHSRFQELDQYLKAEGLLKGESEQKTAIVSAFRDILGIPTFQIGDDFFEAGGDSITAISLVSKLRSLGYSFSVSDLFRYPSPQKLVNSTAAKEVEATPRIQNKDHGRTSPKASRLPLTPIQEWFLDQDLEVPQYWNQSVLIKLNKGTDKKKLEGTLYRLTQMHASLRLAVCSDGESQNIVPPWPPESLLEIVDARTLDPDRLQQTIERTADQIHSELNLDEGRLLKAALIETDAKSLLLLVIHHWCVDAVSWNLLLTDLESMLGTADLPAISEQSGETKLEGALSELRGRATKAEKEESVFWTGQDYSKCPRVLKGSALENLEKDTAEHSFRLSKQETEALQSYVQELFSDIPSALLSSVSKSLSHWLSSSHVLIGIEGHGRDIDNTETSDVVAWMTSYFPLVLDLTHSDSIEDCLNDVQYQIDNVPNKGANYGLIRSQLISQTGGVHIPEPELTFNYLGRKASPPNTKNIEIVDQNIGKNRHKGNRRTAVFEINAAIEDDELQVIWSYNSQIHSNEMVEGLLTEVRDNLVQLSSRARYYGDKDKKGFALSDTQQNLLLHRLSNFKNDQGELNLSGEFKGKISTNQLLNAWEETIKKHPALRSTLVDDKGHSPNQVIRNESVAKIEHIDLMAFQESEQKQKLEELAQKTRGQSLDIAKGPAIRLHLVRLAENRHFFTWKCHHIFLDGWSSSIVLQDVLSIANDGNLIEKDRDEPEADFSAYQRWIASRSKAKAIRFWSNYLEKCSPCLVGSPATTENRDLITHDLGGEMLLKIKRSSQAFHSTPSALLTAAWSLTLSAITDYSSVIFGYTQSGRNTEIRNPHSLVANLANTLPFRTHIDPKQNLRSWIQSLLKNQESTSNFGYISSARILGSIEDIESPNLFDTTLTIANYPWVDNKGEITLTNFQGDTTTSSPLSLSIKLAKSVSLEFDYNKGSFSKSDIQEIAEAFEEIITKLVSLNRRSIAAYLPEDLEERFSNIRQRASRPQLTQKTADTSPKAQDSSSVEGHLTQLFEKTLNLNSCQSSDDFFELGGTSIQAVRLFRKIEQEFKTKFPPSILFSHSTISELAKLIDAGAPQEPSFKNLVIIRPGGNSVPLFLVHAGGLQVLFYRDLANHIESGRPIYGLQAIGRDGSEAPCNSIQEIATRHLSEVETAYNSGPYVLVGHCFGAAIALEMAEQLQKKGKQVPLIVSIDGESPHLLGDDVNDADNIPRYENSFENYPRFLRAPRRLVRNTRRLLRRLRESNRRRFDSFYRQEVELNERLEKSVKIAFRNHRATPYLGRVLAFRCNDSDIYANHTEADWKRAAPNSVMIQMNCKHSEIVANPHAEHLAKEINGKLQELREL